MGAAALGVPLPSGAVPSPMGVETQIATEADDFLLTALAVPLPNLQ